MNTSVFNQSIGSFIQDNIWAIVIFFLWSLFWKALALWKSAREGQKVWFGVLLVVNTAGLLEILYIFYFARHTGMPKATDTKDKE